MLQSRPDDSGSTRLGWPRLRARDRLAAVTDEKTTLDVGVAIVALAGLALALGVGTRIMPGGLLALAAVAGAVLTVALTRALAGALPAGLTRPLALATVTLVGAFLRFRGIDFGLPFVPHPDEPAIVNIAQRMLRTGDLNPHNFIYPSLYLYLQALVYALHLGWGFTQGLYRGVGDLPATTDVITTAPGIYLWGRSLTALLGTAMIPLLWGVGRRLYGPRVGLLAALLLAFSPALIDDAHLITVDVPSAAFTLLAFFWIVELYRAPLDPAGRVRPWPIVRAGIGVGLAFATKYNTGLIALPLILAPLLRGARAPWRVWCGGAAAAALTFLAATPFALRAFPTFLDDTASVITHYKFLGHAAFTGDHNWRYFAHYLWRTLGPAFPLALGGLLALACRQRRADLLVLPFPLLYYGLLAGMRVNFTRNLMPLYPFLALAGAVALVLLARALVALARQLRAARPALPAVRPALCALVALPLVLAGPAASAGFLDNLRATPDARVAAARWMRENLSRDTYWLVQLPEQQWYRQRNVVAAAPAGYGDLAQHPLAWYAANGFGYLLLDSAVYEGPEARPGATAWYREARARAAVVREFRGLPTTFVLLGTGLVAPAMQARGTARFGDTGDRIDLVGYNIGPTVARRGPYFPADGDTGPPTVRAGDGLGITLLWRPLGIPRRDYQLFVHLRDANGQIVAQRDTGPQDGTYPTTAWSDGATVLDSADLALPAALPPGRYTLVIGLAPPGASRLVARAAPDAPALPRDELVLGTIEVAR